MARPDPQQGFRACLGHNALEPGIRPPAPSKFGLQPGVGHQDRNLHIAIESILKRKLDQRPLPQKPPEKPPVEHDNIRGPEYYREAAEGDESC